MQIMIGVCAALALALAVAGWQLKGAWADAASKAELLAQVSETLRTEREQNEKLGERFEQLDRALVDLGVKTQVNQDQLDQAIDAIENVTKTVEDTDEQIACLGTPVPRELDDSLR